MSRFLIRLEAPGNPDFRQFAPVATAVVSEQATLEDCRKAAETYRDDNNLGSGNWGRRSGLVFEDGEYIGKFSYNLRFWTKDQEYGKYSEPSSELVPESMKQAVMLALTERQYESLLNVLRHVVDGEYECFYTQICDGGVQPDPRGPMDFETFEEHREIFAAAGYDAAVAHEKFNQFVHTERTHVLAAAERMLAALDMARVRVPCDVIDGEGSDG